MSNPNRARATRSQSAVRLGLIVLAVLTGWSSTALAGDFVDTRISFVFSDDNVLAGPGETLISSPEPDLGPRDGTFYPWENLNIRDDQDSVLSHMVIYKEMPGFIDNLTTDAALVARIEVLAEPETNFKAGDIILSDGGSYIRARYAIGQSPTVDEETGLTNDADRQLELTFFPINADRFRAGFLFDLSWGGNSIFTDNKSRFATPGFRLRFDWDGFYALAGAKSTRQLVLEKDPTEVSNRELGAFWGGIFGAGWIGSFMGIEANGGIFDSGRIPKTGIQGETVYSYGGSARLSFFNNGLKPAQSIDYRLYRESLQPDFDLNYYLRQPRTYENFTFRASLEGSLLFQTLGDFDNPGSTTTVDAWAAALTTDFFIENFAFSVDGVVRDLQYILFNVPGLDPFLSFPNNSEQTPELLLSARVEYWWKEINLLPSMVFGVQVPAAFRGTISQTTNPSGLAGGKQTVVVPDSGFIIPFPDDTEPLPVYSVRAQLRWDLSEMLSFIGQVTYTWDPNQIGRRRDQATQTAEYYFRDENLLGFAFLSQARF